MTALASTFSHRAALENWLAPIEYASHDEIMGLQRERLARSLG